MCYVKNRRFGWSTLCNNEQIESGTSSKEKKLGIISKTGEDAKEMLGNTANISSLFIEFQKYLYLQKVA